MKDQKSKQFFEMVAKKHKVILGVSIALIVGAALFIPKMQKDTRYDAFLPYDDEVLRFKEHVEETFGLSDPMVIAVVNDNGIFTKESLTTVQRVSEALKQIPGIDPEKITSLSTENNIVGTDDGMLVEPFYEIASLDDAKAREVKRP